MQTESECGESKNTWEYAAYIFNLIRHYGSHGISSYVFWNMILRPGGVSTWGWPQNSLLTIDPEKGRVTYNPEYHVLAHCSSQVNPGASWQPLGGAWSGDSVGFLNKDGSEVVVVHNPFEDSRTFSFQGKEEGFSAVLPPYSYNTFVVPG